MSAAGAQRAKPAARTVPAVVRDADDRDTLLLGLIENVAREQLTPVEEARAYAVLLDEFGLTLGEMAERVGRSKPSVSNRIRLLDLPDDVLGMLERGQLTEGHARAVLAVPDHEGRRRLAREIVQQGTVGARSRAAREVGRREAEAARPRDARRPRARRTRARRARAPHRLPCEGRARARRARRSATSKNSQSSPKRSNAPRRSCSPAATWAIVDSNHGPPPYQSGALTN